MALPHPFSESCEEFNTFKVWHIGEHFVHSSEPSDECLPMFPIALPLAVIRFHDPSVDVVPLSSEKISEASLLLRRKTLQEAFCSGKAAAKDCKNSVSEIWNVCCVALCLLNVREDMSAMRLSMPAIETEIEGEASLTWMRMARALVRRPAMTEREELSLFVQLTVGVLSHHAATCTCFKETRCSKTM